MTTTPTLTLRRAAERGAADHGWLRSFHTFSFADYYDSRHMGFRALRVINEDRVQPGRGFGTHPHRDMEIISYVLSGSMKHVDSMGTETIIQPGEVQRMSAGTGVAHSEFNPSKEEPVHFLQIWIQPERAGLRPSYEQRPFPTAERRGRLQLLASRDGRDGSVTIHQDASLYSAVLTKADQATYEIKAGRHVWVQVARGSAVVNGQRLEAGDGAATSGPGTLTLAGGEDTPGDVLVFDLA